MPLFHVGLWSSIGVALLLTHITIITVTVFLHRSQTHRALDLHWSLSHFFRFWSWLTTGMVTRQWVAVHRKHHAYVDTKEDPHSPVVYGIHSILWLGVVKYHREAKKESVCKQFGHGTPNDWIERNLYSKFNWLGVVIMLGIDLLCFGLWGMMIWLIQIVWIPFFAAGVINGVGHHWGYRNYQTGDSSRNIFPWGILIGGEELHNNHHAYATSAKLSANWYEFDIGYMYIRIFEVLGLAKVLRKAPSLHSINRISSLEERVINIKKARLMLLAQYEEKVLKPVSSHYLAIISLPGSVGNLKQLRSLFSHTSTELKSQVVKLTEDHEILRQLSDHAEKLDKLLCAKCQSAQESLQQLRAWCLSASQSQLIQVRQFSQWLDQVCLSNMELSS